MLAIVQEFNPEITSCIACGPLELEKCDQLVSITILLKSIVVVSRISTTSS